AHHDSDREKRFLFSDLSMGYDYPSLYTTTDSEIFYQDYQSFEGCRIGVSAETSFENILKEYLKELKLNCKLVLFSTEQKAKEAMLRGEIEIMVSSVCVPQTDVKMIDRFGAAPGYIITSLQNEILMDEINNVMQKIRIYTPNLEEILMRTYYNVSMDITNLYLTRQEQQYIDTVGPILIRGFENQKPFGYTDENGEFRGILADYLNHLGKLSGLEFIYEGTEYSELKKTLSTMQDGNFGLFLAGDPEIGLENDLYRTNSLFETSLAYIRKKGDYVAKYDKHVFAVSSDVSYVKELLLATNEESEVLFFEDAKECMEAVLQGKAEMAILSDRIAEYWLQKPVYNNKLTRIAGSGAYVYDICLYVPQEHKELISILNKTLEHISETERRYLLDNFGLSHDYTQSLEDMIYEHNDVIIVFSVLATVILGLGVRFIRFRIKFKDKEALQLKEQIERTNKIFQIVSEHSNRTLYAYDLESRTTEPWDEESEKKDILGHVYAKQYSDENLEQNEGIFDEQKETVKAFFEDIHGGVPTGEMNLRVRLQDKQIRWFHFKYSSIFHQEKPVSAVISAV
ncbi:MAG: transporter substrate-binding domain-containing protein, partial [Lachnospiraceae bacterium]|nr:transporter substrate-binding domain-containing protein [Lachnospiraceae bacterium]